MALHFPSTGSVTLAPVLCQEQLKRKREGARRYIVSLVRSKVFLIHRNE